MFIPRKGAWKSLLPPAQFRVVLDLAALASSRTAGHRRAIRIGHIGRRSRVVRRRSRVKRKRSRAIRRRSRRVGRSNRRVAAGRRRRRVGRSNRRVGRRSRRENRSRSTISTYDVILLFQFVTSGEDVCTKIDLSLGSSRTLPVNVLVGALQNTLGFVELIGQVLHSFFGSCQFLLGIVELTSSPEMRPVNSLGIGNGHVARMCFVELCRVVLFV